MKHRPWRLGKPLRRRYSLGLIGLESGRITTLNFYRFRRLVDARRRAAEHNLQRVSDRDLVRYVVIDLDTGEQI